MLVYKTRLSTNAAVNTTGRLHLRLMCGLIRLLLAGRPGARHVRCLDSCGRGQRGGISSATSCWSDSAARSRAGGRHELGSFSDPTSADSRRTSSNSRCWRARTPATPAMHGCWCQRIAGAVYDSDRHWRLTVYDSNFWFRHEQEKSKV